MHINFNSFLYTIILKQPTRFTINFKIITRKNIKQEHETKGKQSMQIHIPQGAK